MIENYFVFLFPLTVTKVTDLFIILVNEATIVNYDSKMYH